MMGERSAQDKLFAADHVYLDYVGRETLYGYLAQHRGQLFRDEDFAILYCRNNGRPSVPPSLAVSILFLRAYEGVSFVEAIERTKYDLRWKVALGLELEEVPIQKSALQEFQARLVLHEQGEALLKTSIDEARRAGRRLRSLAEQARQEHPEHAEAIQADAALLERLIRQDVEEKPGGGCQIKEGTEKDRLISVHDPEMRHGRKSASKTFNGHKTAVAVDMESQLICGVDVLAGNAGDQEKALELVHQAERVMEAQVEETVGDCAYGGGPTRKAFADEQRLLTAKVPASHNGDCFPKTAFAIDLDRMEVRCPAGQITTEYKSSGQNRAGRFVFADATCQACGLRSQCVGGQGPRSINIQHEERLQQQARSYNQTEVGKKSLRERVVVEHGIARLVRLGIRQSRYVGKTKTRFQVIMAAVVANMSLVVGFCHREQKPAMNTSDPVVQALLTPTYGPNGAQNGFLAVLWASWIRDSYFLLQHTVFGLPGMAACSSTDFSYPRFFRPETGGFWTDF